MTRRSRATRPRCRRSSGSRRCMHTCMRVLCSLTVHGRKYRAQCAALGCVPVRFYERGYASAELSMPDHGLGARGAAALARSLAANTTVQRLDLRHNGLQGAGGAKMAAMLTKNTYIVHANLSHNELGSVGAAAVARMLMVRRRVVFLVGGTVPRSCSVRPPIAGRPAKRRTGAAAERQRLSGHGRDGHLQRARPQQGPAHLGPFTQPLWCGIVGEGGARPGLPIGVPFLIRHVWCCNATLQATWRRRAWARRSRPTLR